MGETKKFMPTKIMLEGDFDGRGGYCWFAGWRELSEAPFIDYEDEAVIFENENDALAAAISLQELGYTVTYV